jgi:hypothetical protein
MATLTAKGDWFRNIADHQRIEWRQVLDYPADALAREARGADLVVIGAAESQSGVAGYGILFKSQPLVIFGLCVMLFHLANAALLPWWDRSWQPPTPKKQRP